MIQIRPTGRNLLILLLLLYLPFLGFTLFNTKGEPREAVVAMSMLQQHDWILPVSNGVDIPYKPPMLAWCIALISEITGGEVTEYTSRLPSAIAMIIMTMGVFCTIRRHVRADYAFSTALIMMTCFELNRSATSCRVDMLLTMFMVMSMLLFFNGYTRNRRIISVGFILMMSGATLTKGPVGAVIPCAVAWIYMLTSGERLWRATWQTALCAILSLLIPAAWYYAAWLKGGDDFYNLMMEENFGRMTGTMSYGSHENPWYYNVMTIIAGMLPYTLIPLMACVLVRWRKIGINPGRWWTSLREANPWNRYSVIIFAFVFLFYCIPASKRSVYLLPLYPAVAYGVAMLAHRLCERSPRILNIYSGIIACVPFIAVAAFGIVRIVRPQVDKASTMQIINGIVNEPVGVLAVLTVALMLVMALMTLHAMRKKEAGVMFHSSLLTAVAIFMAFAAYFQPAVLNGKTDKTVACQLAEMGYGTERQLYGWVNDRLMRFYTVNFYLNNTVINCEKSVNNLPEEFIVGEKEFEKYCLPVYQDDYELFVLRRFDHRSCDLHQAILLVRAMPKRP